MRQANTPRTRSGPLLKHRMHSLASPVDPPARPLRVLFAFSTRLGTPGIGTTGWHQAAELAAKGVELTVACASLERPLPPQVRVIETLRPLGVRLPFRALGFDRTVALHDRRVAALLPGDFDVVHSWPAGALRTLGAARAAGLPALLERPNAHTRFAYEVVAEEHRRLGIEVDPEATHAFDADRLAREEREYAAASHLLCPSDFVARTFLDAGFAPERLLRHRYGYDPARFAAPPTPEEGPLRAIFVGSGEPRKGLHHALEAWLACGAPEAGGRFVICGRIEPAYRELLAASLAHPSVEERGHVADPAAAMREADVLLLPSIEEGSALVTYEARACGCVLAVSDRAGAACRPGEDALVHPAGDVGVLRDQLASLVREPARLAELRAASLAGLGDLTWARAADALADAYRAAMRPPAPGSGGDPGSTLTARMHV
jgi:glycosyltransferase involved in cell wall biosynthesis